MSVVEFKGTFYSVQKLYAKAAQTPDTIAEKEIVYYPNSEEHAIHARGRNIAIMQGGKLHLVVGDAEVVMRTKRLLIVSSIAAKSCII
jgi:hypothetical protein